MDLERSSLFVSSAPACFELWGADLTFERGETSEDIPRPILYEINNQPGLAVGLAKPDIRHRRLLSRILGMTGGLGLTDDELVGFRGAVKQCVVRCNSGVAPGQPATTTCALTVSDGLAAVRLCREAYFARGFVPLTYSSMGGTTAGDPDTLFDIMATTMELPRLTSAELAVLTCCRQHGA